MLSTLLNQSSLSKPAFVIIMIIWVLAIAIMSPSAIMLHVHEEKNYRVRFNSQDKTSPVYWCREDWPSQEMRKIYTTVLFANIYLAPLLPSLSSCMEGLEFHCSRGKVPHTGKQNQEQWHVVSREAERSLRCSDRGSAFHSLLVAPVDPDDALRLWPVCLQMNCRSSISTSTPLHTGWPSATAASTPSFMVFFNENFRRGFQDAFHLQLCQKRAKSKEAYTLRAKNTVVINTSHLSAQGSTVKDPREEIVLCRIVLKSPYRN